jgi:hypothetical protein
MEISIVWCRSLSTGKEFPLASFSGDTDMETDGWASVTSIDRPEVIVTRTVSAEFRGDEPAQRHLQERLNGALGRTDLRAPHLVRVRENTELTGASFQEFRKHYHRPTLFYFDVIVGSGEAEAVREVSVEEFRSSGGLFSVRENV